MDKVKSASGPERLPEDRAVSLPDFFSGKRVLVTGDTGFKGTWLSLWLADLGAQVSGLALDPNTNPSLFRILRLDDLVSHHRIDVRDAPALREIVKEVRPDVVFHLAAQALVRVSYREPLETMQTNVLGTANLLEAVRHAEFDGTHPCTVVVVTSDKCYENRETYYAYREEDRMGGHDVYSMSKGAVELLVSSWRNSFFPAAAMERHGISLTTARAGNVIGGGDWSEDRIVVDCVRSLVRGEPIGVRNPRAVRPWQHVLEPLSGYLQLGATVGRAAGRDPDFLSAWNFGPGPDSERTVGELAGSLVEEWGSGSWKHLREEGAAHEAHYLKLAIDKARHLLGWKPVWGFERAVRETVRWYRTSEECGHQTETMRALCREQIGAYGEDACRLGVAWSAGPRASGA
jgi:CDP-glucose 4,6-dehydratase